MLEKILKFFKKREKTKEEILLEEKKRIKESKAVRNHLIAMSIISERSDREYP